MIHLILHCLQVAIDLGLIMMLAVLVRRLPVKEQSWKKAGKPTSCSTEV